MISPGMYARFIFYQIPLYADCLLTQFCQHAFEFLVSGSQPYCLLYIFSRQLIIAHFCVHLCTLGIDVCVAWIQGENFVEIIQGLLVLLSPYE